MHAQTCPAGRRTRTRAHPKSTTTTTQRDCAAADTNPHNQPYHHSGDDDNHHPRPLPPTQPRAKQHHHHTNNPPHVRQVIPARLNARTPHTHTTTTITTNRPTDRTGRLIAAEEEVTRQLCGAIVIVVAVVVVVAASAVRWSLNCSTARAEKPVSGSRFLSDARSVVLAVDDGCEMIGRSVGWFCAGRHWVVDTKCAECEACHVCHVCARVRACRTCRVVLIACDQSKPTQRSGSQRGV